jgi:signal peptidase I
VFSKEQREKETSVNKFMRKRQRETGGHIDADSKAPKPKRETPVQFSISMMCTLVSALFILTFNVQAFEIPSGSMERTLLVGDHILVDRVELGPQSSGLHLLPHHTIRDGDILVFLSPVRPDTHLVKRVIGVPGDRIRLERGIVFRNGKRVDEPYVIRAGTYIPYRDDFPDVAAGESDGLTPEWRMNLNAHIRNGELVVPPGKYFAMGDNRDNSYDSRYWGFVPEENITGRPLIIYWSFEESSGEYLKTSPSDRVAHASRVALHFFDQTRWNRMFSFVR